MTRIKIKKLVWDVYNLEHISKHNVVQDEVEKVAGSILLTRRLNWGDMQYLAELVQEY